MSMLRYTNATSSPPRALSSFHFACFTETVAHEGMGLIKTARVRVKGQGTVCNFIDLVIVPAMTTIGFHSHTVQDEEIYVVVSGTGLMQVDDQTFEVRQGDVIVNKPGGSHGLTNPGHQELVLVVIDVPVSQ